MFLASPTRSSRTTVKELFKLWNIFERFILYCCFLQVIAMGLQDASKLCAINNKRSFRTSMWVKQARKCYCNRCKSVQVQKHRMLQSWFSHHNVRKSAHIFFHVILNKVLPNADVNAVSSNADSKMSQSILKWQLSCVCQPGVRKLCLRGPRAE